MKTKWSILVECEETNMERFNKSFLVDGDMYSFLTSRVIGILRVDEEKGTNDKTN